MAIQPFLAMTAEEISGESGFAFPVCWMACRFSLHGSGLINLPRVLPANALLAVDDMIPIHGHDPQLILEQLSALAEAQRCRGILLDFQRPGMEETTALVEVLTASLPCPVAVSHFYAGEGTFPVFAPPAPPSVPLWEHLAPWQGREIWLELALDAVEIQVTEDGAAFQPLASAPRAEREFFDESLFCRYLCDPGDCDIRFLLRRDPEDLPLLLAEAELCGVTQAIGLYQEFAASSGIPGG